MSAMGVSFSDAFTIQSARNIPARIGVVKSSSQQSNQYHAAATQLRRAAELIYRSVIKKYGKPRPSAVSRKHSKQTSASKSNRERMALLFHENRSTIAGKMPVENGAPNTCTARLIATKDPSSYRAGFCGRMVYLSVAQGFAKCGRGSVTQRRNEQAGCPSPDGKPRDSG
jgi:hypothetical protein